MNIDIFDSRQDDPIGVVKRATRTETAIVGPDERQWKLIQLDADDTFDVIVQNPLGNRTTIWSLAKDGEEAGVTTSDDDHPAGVEDALEEFDDN